MSTVQATDVATVMKTTQVLIDQMTTNVSELTATQALVKQNVESISSAINTHDTGTRSHSDIRSTMEDLPYMVVDPELEGSTAVKPNRDMTYLLYSYSVLESANISYFIVLDAKGEEHRVEYDSDGLAKVVLSFDEADGTEQTISLQAFATNGFKSKKVTKTITLVDSIAPEFDKINHTVPSVISYGNSYDFTIEGIYDHDDDLAQIDLDIDNSSVTLTRMLDIVQGETYTLTVAEDLVGPSTVNLTIIAKDAEGHVANYDIPMRVNSRIDVSAFSSTIKTLLNSNSSDTVRVNGVFDPDADTIEFSVTSSIPQITFSKSTGLAIQEDFVITVGDVAHDTAYDLTFVFTDGKGDRTAKVISSKINTPPDVSNIEIIKDEYLIPGDSTVVTVNGVTDANGDTVKFNIVCNSNYIYFDKTVGLSLGEPIEVRTYQFCPRGSNAFYIEFYDVHGAKTIYESAITINELPDISSVTTTLPKYVKPGETIECTISAESLNPEINYTFDVTCGNDFVVLADNEGIENGGTFKLTAPTTDRIERGKYFIVTIKMSDGKESAEQMKYVFQNVIGDASGVEITIGNDVVYGGIENGTTIRATGAVDADYNQNFSYKAYSSDESVIFMSNGEFEKDGEVQLYYPKVEVPTTVPLTVIAIDAAGEQMSGSGKIDMIIEPIIVTAPPSILSPEDGGDANYSGFDLVISEYETMAWTGDGSYPQ